jgi:hypothetical protein
LGGDPGTQGQQGDPGTQGQTGNTALSSALALVQGNVVGDTAAALTGAPLPGVDPAPGTLTSVPLTGPVSVVMIDETGSEVANQTVTANGNFILVVPKGHSYMTVLRNEARRAQP